MAPPNGAFNAAVKALFTDIDLDAAQEVLGELGLPAEFSTAAVDKINAKADALSDEAAKLKTSEAPRAKRKAVREKIDRLVNARAFLYRLRPAAPGDVVAEPAAIGGSN